MKFNIEYSLQKPVSNIMLTIEHSDLPVLFPYAMIYPGKLNESRRQIFS